MNNLKISFLLTLFISMYGAEINAHDIAVANAEGETIYYNYINDGKELSVTYAGNSSFHINEYSGKIVIPESVEYNGSTYSVTSIDNLAFAACSNLNSVTIPNTVSSIGYRAFEDCSGLISVNIPNSVKSIENLIFARCSSLTSIVIPNSVTSIGYGAFEVCSNLTSITIPNSVTSIGEYAFYECI